MQFNPLEIFADVLWASPFWVKAVLVLGRAARGLAVAAGRAVDSAAVRPTSPLAAAVGRLTSTTEQPF